VKVLLTVSVADLDSVAKARGDDHAQYHEDVVDLRYVDLAFVFGGCMDNPATGEASQPHGLVDNGVHSRDHGLAGDYGSCCRYDKHRPVHRLCTSPTETWSEKCIPGWCYTIVHLR
jgi:hypothetical protein